MLLNYFKRVYTFKQFLFFLNLATILIFDIFLQILQLHVVEAQTMGLHGFTEELSAGCTFVLEDGLGW